MTHALSDNAMRRASTPLRNKGRPCILLVDDDASIRDFLAFVLTQNGIDVMQAASGREAVEMFHTRVQPVAGVLLDVDMSDMDGPQTLAALREWNCSLPCCFITGGYPVHHTIEELKKLGVTQILEKPFGVRQLLLAVSAMLDQSLAGPDRKDQWACSERRR